MAQTLQFTRWMTRAAMALLCAALTLNPAHAAGDPKASRYYEDALARYQRKDMAGAVIQLKNALKIDRKMLPVHLLLGQALLASDQVVAAEVAFNEALKLGADRSELVLPLAKAVVAQAKPQVLLEDPRFEDDSLPSEVRAQLLVMKAAASGDLGDAAGALKAVAEARALQPERPESWLVETPIRVRARQFPEAIQAADRALAAAPQSAAALYMRGSVEHAMGDFAEAMEWYARALKQQPDHADALIARAGLWVDARKDAEALRDLAELARAEPKDPRGAYLRALVLERQGDKAGAKAALNRVTALVDAVPMAFMRYRPQLLMLGGLAHHGLGQNEKALPYLEAVQRQQPDSPAAKVLAQIYLRQGNLDRAIVALEGYLRGAAHDTQAMHLLASAQLAKGRHARAAELMRTALQTTDSPALRGVLGLSLLSGGKFADGVAELEKAVARDPRQVQAGSALVGIYQQSGQTGRAVQLATTLVTANPKSPGLQSLLGSAQLAAGRLPAARAAFGAALKLDPAFLEPKVRLAGMDLDAQQTASAVARLNEVLNADPANIDAMLTLAGAHRRAGRLDDAQRWIEKADDKAGPDNVQPSLALVEFHLAQGRPDRAAKALDRAVSKQPADLSVLALSARVSLANDDDAAARATLTRASALAGTLAPRLVQIAQLQLEADDLAGSAHSLGKALSERPDFMPAQALMADVEIRRGQFDMAEQRARRIASTQPRLGLGPSLLGDVALARGKPAAALEAYRKAHQIEQSSDSLLRLFHTQLRSNPPAAQQLASQWLKAHPGDLRVRREQADSLARAGNMAAARLAYEALIERAPEDAEALNNLANVLLVGKDPQALSVAERALAQAPQAPHILGTTGWAAYQAGQHGRALQLLREARLRDPGNSETRYFLGTVLASSGRHAEARQELEAALQADLPGSSAQSARDLLKTLN